MWVVELFPFSTHNALCTYTCSKKKKKTPSTVGRALSESLHFFPIEWVRAKQMRLAPGLSLSLSLSLSLLCTSKETWEHESVVLTTTYAHSLNPYIHLTIIENRSSAALSKAAKKKNITSLTHDARGGEERERDEGEERGGGRSKEAKRKRELQQPGFPRGPPPQY